MNTAVQKTKGLQKEKPETIFIVCGGEENTWILVTAESLDKAVDRAEESGLKPHYVVEEKLATSVVGREGESSVEE